MSNSKIIFGLLLIVLSIFTLFAWEKWGKFKFIYEEIAVFKSDVSKGTVITKDMLKVVSWPNKDNDALVMSDMRKNNGKVAAQNIKKNTPLYEEYFDAKEIHISGNDDNYAFQIPSNWVEACPQNLKRHDRVYFYSEGIFITSAWVIDGKDENDNFNITVSNNQILALSKIAQNGRKLVISLDEGD